MELATLEWVDWFSHRRLLGPIGNMPQAEAVALYYRQLTESAQAALLIPKSIRKIAAVLTSSD
ncbi:hypothetical protein D3C86_2245750 [compost metagenome]